MGVGEQAGWQVTERVTTVGVTEIQWDGGADHMIHGEWSRTLPAITLRGARLVGESGSKLIVTLVADGISPCSTDVPISMWTR